MAELAAVLLEEFPIAFEGSVFLRFSVEWVHDLDADTVHSSAEVLDNVEKFGHAGKAAWPADSKD